MLNHKLTELFLQTHFIHFNQFNLIFLFITYFHHLPRGISPYDQPHSISACRCKHNNTVTFCFGNIVNLILGSLVY